MMLRKWIGAWAVGAAALLSGCRHCNQPFFPKKADACAPALACPVEATPDCADACPSKHASKRYFTPAPACKTTACTPAVAAPADPKPAVLPAIPTGTGGKILPDDMPTKPVPSQLPDAGFQDIHIETPPPPIVQDLVADPADVRAPDVQPIEARSTDYSRLSGTLEYSNVKRQWRLRYAPPDGDDEYGGVVSLQGLENSTIAPVEGATAQVRGQLIKPEGKTGSPEYFVHEMTLAGTP